MLLWAMLLLLDGPEPGGAPGPVALPVRVTPQFSSGPVLTPQFTTGPNLTPSFGADA
jgi:hypothetical protein